MEPIKILNPDVAVKLTVEQCQNLGIDITKDKIEANYSVRGPWGVVCSFEALCISSVWEKSGFFNEITSTTIFGKRKLSNPRQSGYCLEGYVSVKGKKYSAFTSSQLIEVDGKLIDIEVIHARVN